MSDFRLLEDVQEQAPTLQVSLSRVGVTNVEKVIRIGSDGTERLYWARLDCFVDLRDRRLALEQCFRFSAQPLDPSRSYFERTAPSRRSPLPVSGCGTDLRLEVAVAGHLYV